MSLESLKLNNFNSNGKDTSPEEFYRNYIENKKFINAFERVLLTAKTIIENNFSDIDYTIYGRIKSANSYFQKSEQKDRIFDIYAFKVIVNNVKENHKYNKKLLIELKDELLNSNANINSNDLLNIAVAKEISNSFTNSSSSFLEDLKARNLVERNKTYIKDNGFVSFQSTTKMYPDSSIRIPCNIEFQCRSIGVDKEASNNHIEYKEEKYGSDLSNLPYETFMDCKTLQDFNCLCNNFVPRYVYINDDKLVIADNIANFLHYYYDYLFECNNEPKSNSVFKHQDVVDKLNYFIDLFYQNPTPDNSSIIR